MRSQSPISRIDALAALVQFSREILEVRIRAATQGISSAALQDRIPRIVYGLGVLP